tara:strand:+ start:191 stop:601 length:411 start_codon:yes stop_codon:yes gene_type:complete
MILGITGSRNKPTIEQFKSFCSIFTELSPVEFHHGCCTGVDTVTSRLVSSSDPGIVIVGHPPIITTNIGKYKSNYNWEPKDYLVRNKDIVKSSEVMIAMPPTEFEVLRSGTWATIRYAQKTNTKLYIIKPDGTYEK